MTIRSIDFQEKRSCPRIKRAVRAVCEIDGIKYRARGYDFSEEGLTLLGMPIMPRAKNYAVICETDDGHKARFVVREVHRILLYRKKTRFLRLGLDIMSMDDRAQAFLHGLKPPRVKPEEEKRTSPPPPQYLSVSRDQKRLQFQLPAFARIGGRTYRCRTVDLCSWGLGVFAPDDFPRVDIYDISFLDPAGKEIPLLVQEKNRRFDPTAEGQLRLGLQIIGGQDRYDNFLKRHTASS
ncbi:MAG: PilZ domain-containing protein [Acidobacteriota bacterium]|nr:PilZ domain-containing protein [Acidobacteriota bacterium]